MVRDIDLACSASDNQIWVGWSLSGFGNSPFQYSI
jgi:hypothetical protein